MGKVKVDGEVVADEGQNVTTTIKKEIHGSEREFTVSVEQHTPGSYARVGIHYGGQGNRQLVNAGTNATIEGFRVSHERE